MFYSLGGVEIDLLLVTRQLQLVVGLDVYDNICLQVQAYAASVELM